VKDVLAKSLGSRNPINTAWATLECLKQFKRAEQVSEARGVPVEEMVPWLVREMAAQEAAGVAAGEPAAVEEEVSGGGDAADQA
jgi:hypothetical protein